MGRCEISLRTIGAHAYASRCVLLAFALLAAATAGAADKRPNVILVLVDDMGWMDLSCQGSDYFVTPHIDRLAREGMRFTNAYAACAVCSPTRAAVLTGRSPGRLGVTDWIRARFQRGAAGTPSRNPTEYVGGPKRRLLCPPNPFWLERNEVTIAEVLRENGYRTCHIGKWHLGDPGWYPLQQGFDVNIGGCDIGQPPSYFDPYKHPRYGFDGKLSPRRAGEFLTHREGAEAVRFIEESQGQPFFLYYCPYAVHTPIQAIDSVTAKYRRDGKKEINAKYAAMVESVDDAVGMLMSALQSAGISEDTIIIFTSDNGGLAGPTDNRPLRSGKGYAYEGGIRVPLIVRWPNVVEPGVTSDEPVISMDLFPTIVEATGSTSDDRPRDGESLSKLLRTQGQQELARDALYWHFPHYRHAPGPYSIIREGDWKLIKWYEGPMELYNLSDDLGERVDRTSSDPDVARELERKLAAELKRIDARIPRPNPAYQESAQP